MKELLVVVDYQNDFVIGTLANKRAKALEKPLAQRVKQVLADGGYVLFTLDTHSEDYLSSREGEFLPIAHCEKGSYGWELHGALGVYQCLKMPRVALLEKSSFGADNIAAAVMRLCAGAPDEISLAGVVTDICVISNAVLLQTYFQYAKIKVYDNLCAAATKPAHLRALQLMHNLGMESAE